MVAWLKEWPARVAPMADLVCLPGAGAGASAFRDWAADLPPWASVLAVQLPGRETRIAEPPVASLAEAAEQVARACLARPARPAVIFGHSMGAALGHEVARVLAAAGRSPCALVLAASTPPRGRGGGADPAELRTLLLAYDPENRRITGDAELYEALAPVLAADIAMLRRHRAGGPPLGLPAHLLAGETDPVVPPGAVVAWAAHFNPPPATATLPGGHFFPFREARGQVLAMLARLLGEALR